MAEPLLQVEDLRTYFYTPRGVAKAVDGVGFAIARGETRVGVGGGASAGAGTTALVVLL